MNRIALLVVLFVIGLSSVASADPILSAVGHTGSASAGTTSADYRYVRRGSPRTGITWAWVLFSDEQTQASGAAPLDGSSGTQTSAGSYFAPVYSGAGLATNSLSNTDTLATYQVHLEARTTITTPKVAHQRLTASSAASDTLSITLAQDTAVSLVATANSGGTLKIVDMASGETIFWTSALGSFSDVLSAGTYQITGSVTNSALQDTHISVYANLGDTTNQIDYTLTASVAN